MEERHSIARLEGFDRNGNYWYQTFTQNMKPEISAGMYLCLRRVTDIDKVTGFNGEIYLLVTESGGVVSVNIGHVINEVRKSNFVRLLTVYPTNCTYDIPKGIIVEQYIVLCTMKEMPTPWHP